MAQQSKITSRPMTKALGTASILSMAISGANVANAIQTDFGVEYRADAFYIDGDAYGDDGSGNALANLLRVKADFKDESTGVSVHTSVQLSGDTWTGDDRGMRTNAVDGVGEVASVGTPGSYNNDANESVTLDTGYVQIPVAGNLIRVGRQASNWNNCFLTCDDRRDRFSALFPTSVGTFVFNYDRRNDDANDLLESNDSGDSPMLAYVTRFGDMNFGILYVHYLKNSGRDADGEDYALQGAHIISPYLSGALTDGVNLTVGFNWVGGNEENDENSFFGDGTADYSAAIGAPAGTLTVDYTDAWSQYVRLDGDVGALNWGVQYFGAIDGGLIDPGFDTYFSTLNNNPASTGNPTSLVSVGRGYGMEDYDQHVLASKLGFDITPRLNITGAVVYMDIDNAQFDVDDSSMIYDLSASYQINEAVTTVASFGVVGNNEALMINNFNPGSGGNQFGVGAPSEFADEDLMAANVGLRVKF